MQPCSQPRYGLIDWSKLMSGLSLLAMMLLAASTRPSVRNSRRGVAENYEFAPSTVVKWSKRVRETGSAAPAKFGGYRTCTLEPHRDFLLMQLKAVPHLTLHKLKDML